MAFQKECNLRGREEGQVFRSHPTPPHPPLDRDTRREFWVWSCQWPRRGTSSPQTFSWLSPPQDRGLLCVPPPPSLCPPLARQFLLPSKPQSPLLRAGLPTAGGATTLHSVFLHEVHRPRTSPANTHYTTYAVFTAPGMSSSSHLAFLAHIFASLPS